MTVEPAAIPPVNKALNRLAFGGSYFGTGHYADALLETMALALGLGLNHFDTAAGYGDGASERLIGRFLADGHREAVFVASKASADTMDSAAMLEMVDRSLERLGIDSIDLYYIHWPRQGKDLRPWMEGLETARAQGKITAIGVSNFNTQQMEQVAEVGRIDAHQLCYSLLWRFAEDDIIPYCRQRNIAVVTYSSIAQGVLTGKFPREPQLAPDDQRAKTTHFDPAVWPHVYEAVEQMKAVAADAGRPLAHLAIRWVLRQPGIHTAVVSARTPEQVRANVAALEGDIPDAAFERLTAISDAAMRHVPDTGNMYRYYP